MRSLYGLAWRNLASRRLRTFLTATAISLGVASVFATSLIGQSAQARTTTLSKQISHADLQITPREDDTLDARWLDAARAHPDVALASPEIVHTTLLLEPSGASLILLGVEPQVYVPLEQIEMASGRSLISASKPWVIVPERWAQEYHLTAGGRLLIPRDTGEPIELLVVGLIQHRDDAGAVIRDRTGLVPLPALQDALGLRRQLTRIRLTLQPGRDLRRAEESLARALDENALAPGNPVVVSKVDAGDNSGVLYGMMIGGLALTGAVILLAAALLIFNTFAMNVTDRTRVIGILRSLGASREAILRGVLVEAMLLGAVGTLVGLPLGWGLAQGIVRALVLWQRLEWEQLSLSIEGLLIAPFVGMGVALVSALLPARRASRVPPLAAIHPHRESRSERDIPWTWMLGLGLLLSVMGVEIWMALTPSARALDFTPVMLLCNLLTFVALVGGVLLLPPLSTGLAALLRHLLSRHFGVIGRLVGDQLTRSGNRQRTMLTAGTLAVGVAMVILLSSTVGALVRVSEDLIFGLMREQFGILAFSPQESLEASNPLSIQRQKEWPRPIVAMLDSLRDRAYVYGLSFSEPVKGFDTPGGIMAFEDVESFLRVGSFRYQQGDLETAVRILRQGRGILITPSVARRYNVGVGDALVVKTRRGPTPFRVAAIGANPWWAPIVTREDAETYFGVSLPIGYFVTPKPGVDASGIEARLREGIKTRPEYKLFRFGPGSEAVKISVGRTFDTLTALLNGLTILSLVIASLGQINTMMASVVERVRELGVLRSVGLTRGQLQMLVLLEAAAVGVMGAIMGALIGTVAALADLFMFFAVAVEAAGFGAPTWASLGSGMATAFSNTRWIALFALAFAPLVTMFAAWLPARRAARWSVVETIRSDSF